ncbi:histidinol dehydrogenase [Agrococcus casei]|uniref:Histidinol dehydrogenase n=2 Tax=Agrococcus TaxID=46352 RepID=A0A1R4G5C4_9MICO|nr:histidinol dehydrogenase [Agrococcus casei]SJM63339.1 Histidinol dehydrogenase [Agrococcus casei LMG 22410]
MLRRLTLASLPDDLDSVLPRAESDVAAAAEAVHALIDDVRSAGADALLDQAERFDRVRPASIRVPSQDLAAALEGLDPTVRAALEQTIERVRQGSAAQIPPAATTRIADGAVIDQRWVPVERVGLYVPGGKAVYPSSVIMNAVAAQAAGVTSIAVASPAQASHDGAPHPTILATCALLGVDEVYAMGGAGAIGAFAYGVEGIGLRRVDVVTGPGNVFVAAAKRAVAGRVAIDAEAGPTEILVLADDTANPELVARDLISQAEHDELAGSVLVTDSAKLADSVDEAIARIVPLTKHSDRIRAALTGRQSASVVVDSLDSAVRLANAYAAEHLQIMTADADSVVEQIVNAGVVFVGDASPVALGDYAAGSNHVLPTGGTARFAAGLNASVFLRSQQVVRYTMQGLAGVRGAIETLAVEEDLPAHGEAVTARFED